MTKMIDKQQVAKNYLLSRKENLFITRLCSFFIAIIFSLIILFNPHFIASSPEAIQHGLLSFQLLAISLGFIHGIGFSAENFYVRFLLSPFCHWPVMLSLLV